MVGYVVNPNKRIRQRMVLGLGVTDAIQGQSNALLTEDQQTKDQPRGPQKGSVDDVHDQSLTLSFFHPLCCAAIDVL